MTCICPEHYYKDRDGYPKVKHGGKPWRLNRLMWTLCYGDIPTGMVVAHKCNNKGCVNPEHFYLATPERNSSDAARDRLYRYGADNHKTRWSDEVVLEMYRLFYEENWKQTDIALKFGVAQTRISELLRKRGASLYEREAVAQASS